jgi:hypothetical protein
MNTARNQSKVMAVVLRASVKVLRDLHRHVGHAVDNVEARAQALESIEAVAEELEAIAYPRPKCCSPRGRAGGTCPNLATMRYRRVHDGRPVCYARCDGHPLRARAGTYEAEPIATPESAR